MGLSRQEHWSRLPFPASPGIELGSPATPAVAGRLFDTEPLGKLHHRYFLLDAHLAAAKHGREADAPRLDQGSPSRLLCWPHLAGKNLTQWTTVGEEVLNRGGQELLLTNLWVLTLHVGLGTKQLLPTPAPCPQWVDDN